MSTSPENPTIVIVQGSFQTPLVYADLFNKLTEKGYPTIHPKLPSCTDVSHPDFPSKDLIDDALAVRSAVTRLVEYESKTVVLVMHSYGGLVGSEAVPPELSYAHRKSKGLEGGVIHLFYFTAFIMEEENSVLGTFGESPNSIVSPNGTFTILNPEKVLYGDLPPSEAERWTSRLIPQSYAVQKTKLTRAAWKYIPSTYLIGTNDQAVPKEYQEGFAKMAGAEVVKESVGHSAMLSHLEVLVGRILGAVKSASERTKGV
ncbi:hypothetical protein HYFRA_00011040 [Hymenoscyphus fraxineus]|uniref:AB hydrolase-1 domain-containing protein n=1 Tax=Hymenoscyphus fraxineus TaxID=746836 RepID=A0A9N9L5A2_9HELO|nr:hypothetical protein HYFRA_00011040 [Hymenoscyphus fraxineus]